jgi:hypothetical protein
LGSFSLSFQTLSIHHQLYCSESKILSFQSKIVSWTPHYGKLPYASDGLPVLSLGPAMSNPSMPRKGWPPARVAIRSTGGLWTSSTPLDTPDPTPLTLTIDCLFFLFDDLLTIASCLQLPEEVHNQLESLPEQWNNTKKIAIQVKRFQPLSPFLSTHVHHAWACGKGWP